MSNMDMPGSNNLTPEERAKAAAERANKIAEIRKKYGGTVQPEAQEDTIANRYGKPEVKIDPHREDDFAETTKI
jgi:hypothetical protein